jgi:hypothetical protein
VRRITLKHLLHKFIYVVNNMKVSKVLKRTKATYAKKCVKDAPDIYIPRIDNDHKHDSDTETCKNKRLIACRNGFLLEEMIHERLLMYEQLICHREKYIKKYYGVSGVDHSIILYYVYKTNGSQKHHQSEILIILSNAPERLKKII